MIVIHVPDTMLHRATTDYVEIVLSLFGTTEADYNCSEWLIHYAQENNLVFSKAYEEDRCTLYIKGKK